MSGPSTEETPTYVGVVYPADSDHMGHVNIARYAAIFDAANWTFFARHGLSRPYFEASGCGMAALAQETTYHKELFPGDTIVAFTELLEVREKTIRYRHQVRRSTTGDLVATSELIAAHLNRTQHRAVAFPAEIREALRSGIVAHPQ
ncbi:MAG: thioesterase family protein [Thermaerobacter sp.]|nr:thioesterase family protein [Thermaerobacter sp.]